MGRNPNGNGWEKQPTTERIRRRRGSLRESETRSAPAERRDPVRRPPVLSISRAVSIDVDTVGLEWDAYINKLARVNQNLPIRSRGGMAVTYVQADEMNAMLQKKFPDTYTDVAKIKTLHEGFVENFEGFLTAARRAKRQTTSVTHDEHFYRDGSSKPLQLPDDPLENMWERASIPVKRRFVTAGAYSLALDLGGNPLLAEEMGMVKDFLRRDERLDVTLIRDGNRVPHLGLLRTEGYPVRDAEMQLIPGNNPPEEVTLLAPKMRSAYHANPVSQIPEIRKL